MIALEAVSFYLSVTNCDGEARVYRPFKRCLLLTDFGWLCVMKGTGMCEDALCFFVGFFFSPSLLLFSLRLQLKDECS